MLGDQHGYGYVLDMCNTGRGPSEQHHLIPKAAADAMDEADVAYANAKGCFAIPDPAACEDLIHAYFHYVHPTLPIIDIDDFFDRYWGTSTAPFSMLLLWSMFSIAASVSLVLCESHSDWTLTWHGSLFRTPPSELTVAKTDRN